MEGIAKIHFNNGDYLDLFGGIVLLTNRNHNLGSYDKITEAPHLIVFSPKHLQTYLDVSGIEEHLLISFDAEKNFIGATSCHSPNHSSFVLLTQAKYAVLIKERLVNFNVPGINHIETDYYVI